MTSFKKVLRIAWQVGLLTLFSQLGLWLSGHFHWLVPGNVVGLLLLLVLLLTKVIRLDWVDFGGSWLLADMLLFFIPAAVGVIQYKQVMMASGVQLVLVIAVSTAVVMVCTGVAADLLVQHRARRKGEEDFDRT